MQVMRDLDLLDELQNAGMTKREGYDVLRWQDGRVIASRPDPGWNRSMFGNDSK